MYLIQILLPLYDNEGQRFGAEQFNPIRHELSARFGGLTAFTRAPAEGVWEEHGKRQHDDVVVYEVMADALDRTWWRDYRSTLEREFRQDVILIRSQAVELL